MLRIAMHFQSSTAAKAAPTRDVCCRGGFCRRPSWISGTTVMRQEQAWLQHLLTPNFDDAVVAPCQNPSNGNKCRRLGVDQERGPGFQSVYQVRSIKDASFRGLAGGIDHAHCVGRVV